MRRNMESKTCEVEGCRGEAKIAIMHTGGYAEVKDAYYCPLHGSGLLDDIWQQYARHRRETAERVDACAVNVESLVCDGREGFPSLG
jgi:hypothetical protein